MAGAVWVPDSLVIRMDGAGVVWVSALEKIATHLFHLFYVDHNLHPAAGAHTYQCKTYDYDHNRTHDFPFDLYHDYPDVHIQHIHSGHHGGVREKAYGEDQAYLDYGYCVSIFPDLDQKRT